MQIIRNNNLNLAFPATTPQTNADTQAAATPATPAAPANPPVLTAKLPPPVETRGVIYTGSGNTGAPAPEADYPDLDSMSLESQLEFGRNKGVFTKITLSKDGVLVAKPHGGSRAPSVGFAASAAATIKDFEEGIASLKQHTSDASEKSSSALSGRFKSLQQLTAKLNVFA